MLPKLWIIVFLKMYSRKTTMAICSCVFFDFGAILAQWHLCPFGFLHCFQAPIFLPGAFHVCRRIFLSLEFLMCAEFLLPGAPHVCRICHPSVFASTFSSAFPSTWREIQKKATFVFISLIATKNSYFCFYLTHLVQPGLICVGRQECDPGSYSCCSSKLEREFGAKYLVL